MGCLCIAWCWEWDMVYGYSYEERSIGHCDAVPVQFEETFGM